MTYAPGKILHIRFVELDVPSRTRYNMPGEEEEGPKIGALESPHKNSESLWFRERDHDKGTQRKNSF